MLDVLYIPVMRIMFETMSCKRREDGFAYLKRASSFVCWEDQHYLYVTLGLLLILTMMPYVLNNALWKNETDPMFRFLPKFNVSIITCKFIIIAVVCLSPNVKFTTAVIAVMLFGLFSFNTLLQPCLGEGNHFNSRDLKMNSS